MVVVRVPTRFVRKYTIRAQLKPSGGPEPASWHGRPAAAGDRRGSVRNKRTFWLNSSAAWNMTRSVFRICQIQYQKPHFMDRAVKTVAYLRVSTPQQDVSSQRLAILEYARAHDFRIDDFIEATASGQASEKRRRLDELTRVRQRGDRLVVSELSRLGRSLGQIVTISDALAKAGVAFVALKEEHPVRGPARHPERRS